MNKEELIQSGLLELYALNHCTESEKELVEQHLGNDEVKQELNTIEENLFSLAQAEKCCPEKGNEGQNYGGYPGRRKT